MFNRTNFNQKIQDEFNNFTEETLNLQKDEVFKKSNEIDLKTNLSIFLQDHDSVSDKLAEKLDKIKDNILDTLYINYVENDGDFFYLNLCDDVITSYLELNDFESEEDYNDKE